MNRFKFSKDAIAALTLILIGLTIGWIRSGIDARDILKANYGYIKSYDAPVLDLGRNFNAVSTTQIGDKLLEIELRVDAHFVAAKPSTWSLIIRVPPGMRGEIPVSQLDVRLFSDYASECCVNPKDPIGKFESYSKAYVAVDGSIDLISPREGKFNLLFQRERPGRSGKTMGDIVKVAGCWENYREGPSEGCRM